VWIAGAGARHTTDRRRWRATCEAPTAQPVHGSMSAVAKTILLGIRPRTALVQDAGGEALACRDRRVSCASAPLGDERRALLGLHVPCEDTACPGSRSPVPGGRAPRGTRGPPKRTSPGVGRVPVHPSG